MEDVTSNTKELTDVDFPTVFDVFGIHRVIKKVTSNTRKLTDVDFPTVCNVSGIHRG